MSEKRFYIHCADNINKQLIDTESDFNIHIEEISNEELLIQLCNLLNKLSEENEQLKRRLEKINGGYGHLTHRKGLTANEWLIKSQEKELNNCKNDYRELFSNYVELEEENEQLKSTITHLQEECGARENDYVNLKKQLDKIPPRIKEIWLNG